MIGRGVEPLNMALNIIICSSSQYRYFVFKCCILTCNGIYIFRLKWLKSFTNPNYNNNLTGNQAR